MIKTIIAFLLLVFVLGSCKEEEKQKEIVIATEETEAITIDNLEVVLDTLKNEQANVDFTLPTPDTTLVSNNKLGMIDKLNNYLKSNFKVSIATKVLETTTANHPEGIYDCHERTEYDNIIFETYTCDMQLENTLEFKDYSFKEVKRVLSILFIDNDDFKWYNAYRYEPKEESGAACFLEIKEDKNNILVSYGCGC